MSIQTNKAFMRPAILALGTMLTLIIGGVSITTQALAPESNVITRMQHTDTEQVDVIDETGIVDGLTQKQRIAKVREYFASYDMPAANHAEAFVTYADTYDIDWTLVPAIAFLESTGFKNSCTTASYSGLGWGSCKINFSSYDESIRIVSMNLGGHNPNTEHYYEGKTPKEILHSYNPKYVQGISTNYHGNALAIMDEIKVHPASATQLAYSK